MKIIILHDADALEELPTAEQDSADLVLMLAVERPGAPVYTTVKDRFGNPRTYGNQRPPGACAHNVTLADLNEVVTAALDREHAAMVKKRTSVLLQQLPDRVRNSVEALLDARDAEIEQLRRDIRSARSYGADGAG